LLTIFLIEGYDRLQRNIALCSF